MHTAPTADSAAMEEIKARANQAFSKGHFIEADTLYTEALSHLAAIAIPQTKPATGGPCALKQAAESEPRAFPVGSAADAALDANRPSAEKSIANGVDPSSSEQPSSARPADALHGEPVVDPALLRAKAIILSNRALMRIRLEQYGFAMNDANDAVALDPTYVKAYHRRGTSHFALGDVKAARRDFREILRVMPNDQDARTKLAQCDKVLKEERFAKAIESVDEGLGQGPMACETIDVDNIVVEEEYAGPVIDKRDGVDMAFVTQMMEAFRKEKKLHFKYTCMLVLQAKRLFDEMQNIVTVPVPKGAQITVCGDVHGQYYDLAESIFNKNGLPSKENPYVFNGDFVDRGSFSVEVMLTLLAFKVACPESIHLTRGNHESQNMNKIYGFEGEVKAKYHRDIIFHMFSELFQSLPLAYILDGAIDGAPDGRRAFIVHGGLFSRDGVTIKELQSIDRRREPDDGLLAEMLWSDPQDAPGWGPSKRGIGVAFGPDVTHRFLDANGLDILVRSHEMKEEGYEVGADGRLVTIFSAPNYCDQMGNKGAYIHFDYRMKPKFTQFSAVPHPNVKAMAYARNMMGLM